MNEDTTPTETELLRIFSSTMDSVNLITSILNKAIVDNDDKLIIARNASHIYTILNRYTWDTLKLNTLNNTINNVSTKFPDISTEQEVLDFMLSVIDNHIL